jgi:hypothetical protein
MAAIPAHSLCRDIQCGWQSEKDGRRREKRNAVGEEIRSDRCRDNASEQAHKHPRASPAGWKNHACQRGSGSATQAIATQRKHHSRPLQQKEKIHNATMMQNTNVHGSIEVPRNSVQPLTTPRRPQGRGKPPIPGTLLQHDTAKKEFVRHQTTLTEIGRSSWRGDTSCGDLREPPSSFLFESYDRPAS